MNVLFIDPTQPLGPQVAINMCFIHKYINVNFGQYQTFYIYLENKTFITQKHSPIS